MQGAVHRQPLYFHKYKHFIRLAHSKLKVAPVLLNAQFKAQSATFCSCPVQTSQDEGANSSTAQCCVRLGRVPRSCSRRHTSMAHEEATLQRCRSAAAVEVACSPLKTCLQSYLQSRRLGGAPPREDPRRNKSSMRAEASAGLDKLCTRAARRSTEPVSLRHLLSHSGTEKKVRRTTSRWTNH